jgi:hypothetical protein
MAEKILFAEKYDYKTNEQALIQNGALINMEN